MAVDLRVGADAAGNTPLEVWAWLGTRWAAMGNRWGGHFRSGCSQVLGEICVSEANHFDVGRGVGQTLTQRVAPSTPEADPRRFDSVRVDSPRPFQLASPPPVPFLRSKPAPAPFRARFEKPEALESLLTPVEAPALTTIPLIPRESRVSVPQIAPPAVRAVVIEPDPVRMKVIEALNVIPGKIPGGQAEVVAPRQVPVSSKVAKNGRSSRDGAAEPTRVDRLRSRIGNGTPMNAAAPPRVLPGGHPRPATRAKRVSRRRTRGKSSGGSSSRILF